AALRIRRRPGLSPGQDRQGSGVDAGARAPDRSTGAGEAASRHRTAEIREGGASVRAAVGKGLAWGILGTGGIARTFAEGITASESGTLIAVGSRTQETADRFAHTYGVARRYTSYEALLADPDVQAVYIA